MSDIKVDDSQRSKARNKHKKKSQKKHTSVKPNHSSRAKKKKVESGKRKSGHKSPAVLKESVREQKMRTIRHSCASTTSDNKTDRSTPKNVIVQQREVDDDEVNKLVEKYKTKKDYCIVPKTNIKKYIQLDQRIKMKATVPLLHRKKSNTKKAKEGAPNGNNEEKDGDGTTSTTPTSRTPLKNVSSRNPVDISPFVVKEVEEDKYDSYPKIEEVLKLPPEDIYNGEVNPNWMIYLEPFDDDLKDTEPPCTVGSEQIEMYHAKKFKLHIAPEQKLILDQWESSAVLVARNELFFTAPLVFSNTIRSLINVASAKTDKKEKLNQKSDDKPVSIEVIELDRAKCFIYSRANPIVSVAEKNYMKPEEIPCIEDLSMHASKFKKQ